MTLTVEAHLKPFITSNFTRLPAPTRATQYGTEQVGARKKFSGNLVQIWYSIFPIFSRKLPPTWIPFSNFPRRRRILSTPSPLVKLISHRSPCSGKRFPSFDLFCTSCPWMRITSCEHLPAQIYDVRSHSGAVSITIALINTHADPYRFSV